MIHIAKKGDEELEARGVSRRGFLRMLAGGAASAVMPMPTKSYFFFGGIHRPAPALWTPPNNLTHMIMAGGIAALGLLFFSPGELGKLGIVLPKQGCAAP